MKTMTIYGPNRELLEARKESFFIAVKSEKKVCLVCRCNDPLAMVWFVKYIGPGYYHGVCPYCQTEIGIEKRDRCARLSGARIDKVKSVIRDKYVDATLGLYFTRNWTGDLTFTIWEEDGVTIDICYYYEYFEVFGLTEKEENELLAFYNSLNENMKKVEEHRLCVNKLLSRLWKKDKEEGEK